MLPYLYLSGGQRSTSAVTHSQVPSIWCLEQGLFIGLEVTELPRVASQGVPGIPLSPPPQSWDHKFMWPHWLLTCVSENKTQVLAHMQPAFYPPGHVPRPHPLDSVFNAQSLTHLGPKQRSQQTLVWTLWSCDSVQTFVSLGVPSDVLSQGLKATRHAPL